MPEKELTKKLTQVIKDVDKLVQTAEKIVKSLKELKELKGEGQDADK